MIVDAAEYERLIVAHAEVVEAARVRQEAVRMMVGSGSSGTGYADYQRALKALEAAQKSLSKLLYFPEAT